MSQDCGRKSKDFPYTVGDMRKQIIKDYHNMSEKFRNAHTKTDIHKMNKSELCKYFKPKRGRSKSPKKSHKKTKSKSPSKKKTPSKRKSEHSKSKSPHKKTKSKSPPKTKTPAKRKSESSKSPPKKKAKTNSIIQKIADKMYDGKVTIDSSAITKLESISNKLIKAWQTAPSQGRVQSKIFKKLSFKDRDEITELAKHAYSRAKASGSSVFARSIESPFASMIGRAVEYVITEFLELAGTVANNDDRNTITLNDLKKVAKSDKELELVFKMTK